MNKVKDLMVAGASIPMAIRTALGMTVSEFAEKYGRPQNVISAIINGGRRATDDDIAAFVSELGGEPDEWRKLLHEAGRPVEAAS